MNTMQQTFSQKVARVFEVIDYFLLVPAAVGALTAFFALVSGSAFGLLLFVVLLVGIILQVGYFKHARGRLDEYYVSRLWIGTAVYNFLLLLPWLYGVSSVLQTGGLKNRQGNTDTELAMFYFFLVGVVLAYVAAIVFAVKAYSFEKRKKIL